MRFIKSFSKLFHSRKKLYSIKCIDDSKIIETAIIVPQKKKEQWRKVGEIVVL